MEDKDKDLVMYDKTEETKSLYNLQGGLNPMNIPSVFQNIVIRYLHM